MAKPPLLTPRAATPPLVSASYGNRSDEG